MKISQSQLERWAKIRQKGRTRYIWLNGVLVWGLMTGLCWAIAMAALLGWARLPIFLPLALILFPIGGFFYGHWTWKILEKEFEKASREKTKL